MELSWRGSGHLSEQFPDGYSCDNCDASWDKEGDSECGPTGTFLSAESATTDVNEEDR